MSQSRLLNYVIEKKSHLRHRFAPCNEEVIPQCHEVNHTSAIFATHVPRDTPLNVSNACGASSHALFLWRSEESSDDTFPVAEFESMSAVRVVRVCLHKPNPTGLQLLQACRKTLRAAAGFLEEVVEFPQNTLPRQDTL